MSSTYFLTHILIPQDITTQKIGAGLFAKYHCPAALGGWTDFRDLFPKFECTYYFKSCQAFLA